MPTAARRCGRRRAGPKNVSLEKCDLGKGPGKVDGAFAELPRYFADAGQRDGPRDAPAVVHGEAAGLQARRSGQEAVSGRRPAGEGPRRDRDLRRQQVERHEVRRQARPAAGEGGGRRWARPSSSAARARTISPAPPATTTPASASGCRGCRISPSRRKRSKVVGEWPAYRVSTTQVMTMQHRLYDCYWQMRMPELEIGSDVSVALISYLAKQRRGRRDRRARAEALSGAHHANDRIAVLVLLAGARQRVRAAEARRRSRPRSMPPSWPRSRPRRPTGSRGFDQDETMKAVLGASRTRRRRPVADAIATAREGQHRISRRRQAHRRLEDGREARAVRLWAALHRLSGAPGQRRQLLRLPSARPRPRSATARSARACWTTARSATSARPTPRRPTRRSTTRRRAYPCSNMPRFGTNKVLTIEQIKDLVALLMSPDSPVNK